MNANVVQKNPPFFCKILLNLFTTQLCAASAVFAAFALGSCNDHDFDWEEAHRQNAEYNYEQNFAQIFGEINPNQNWDLSSGMNVYSATRALPSNNDLRNWDRWTAGNDGWYNVEDNTIQELQQRLPESDDNLHWGTSFICKVPDCGFSITPIYQGGNNHSPILHMIVTYEGRSTDYTLWGKGDKIEKSLCNTCQGDGETCSSCGGDGIIDYYCKVCGQTWSSEPSNTVKNNHRHGNRSTQIDSRTCPTCEGSGNHQEVCPDCHGNGGDWVSANTLTQLDIDKGNTTAGYSGTTTGAINNRSLATRRIRGRTLRFDRGEIPYGAIITFRADVSFSGNNKRGSEYNPPYYSTPPTGKSAMILALEDIPTPTNIVGKKTNGVQHQVLFISAEAGSDTDMNDVVFLMEGDPYVPQRIEVTEEDIPITTTLTKRYMVEDMGYAAPTSIAALSNYTDIDFNDIVIDFTATTSKTVHISNDGLGHIEERVTSGPTVTKSAKIRALGGTWDFVLFVEDKIGTTTISRPVFCKSLSGTTGTTVINGKNSMTLSLPSIETNTAYPLFASGTTTNFVAGRMYNTGWGSDARGDNHYKTEPEKTTNEQGEEVTVDESWLCEIKGDAVDAWDPDKNNLRFLIVNDVADFAVGDNFYKLFDSSKEQDNEEVGPTDNKNVYYNATFPAIGATPKIVAFDKAKHWQRERVHITSNWFNDPTKALNESGQFEE